MLASDLNNPEFMGAKDPDSGLYVEFFWHEAVDGWASREKSLAEQRNVVVKLPKAPFVRIMVPGDKTSEFTAAVNESHKQRFPRQWMAWQIAEGLIGGDGDIPGWKLAEWDEISPDMCRELLYLRFQTVEQLAGANDKQIQGVGIGGLGLREKARAALRNKMGAETREALEAERAEKEELRERLARMEEAMSKILAGQAAVPADAAPEVPAVVAAAEKPAKAGKGAQI
jgi:hypothetical protein